MRISIALLFFPLWMTTAIATAQDYALDQSHSLLTFTSVKNGAITEVHQWGGLQGHISGNKAQIALPTAAIDTGIPIRDQRMREHVFSGVEALQVSATAAVPNASGVSHVESQITLTFQDQRWAKTIAVIVSRSPENRLVVTPLQPFVMQASAVNLGDGLEKLREIAGLDSIAPSVMVDFHLEFTP